MGPIMFMKLRKARKTESAARARVGMPPANYAPFPFEGVCILLISAVTVGGLLLILALYLIDYGVSK